MFVLLRLVLRPEIIPFTDRFLPYAIVYGPYRLTRAISWSFNQLVSFFDNTCRAPLITSIPSSRSGDNLCLLLVNIIPLKLNSRSVPDDVAGIDKILRASRFKLGNFTEPGHLTKNQVNFLELLTMADRLRDTDQVH